MSKKTLNDLESFIFSYEKIKNRIAGKPAEKEKIIKSLKEIRGYYSKNLIIFLRWFLDATFRKLYHNIDIHYPEHLHVEKLKDKYHLILVPNHQSHVDYLAMSYIFYKNFKHAIFAAGGINLNIFPIGYVFRKCGAFFIRRSFQTDIAYALTFEAYIASLLKENKTIEFFFEGGRSRTGKLLKPRYGLFQMIIEAHKHLTAIGETNKPLLFLPVSIAHEQVPEIRAHIRELAGNKKKKENFWQLFSLLTIFKKRFGSIYVRLSEGIEVSGVDDLKKMTQDLAFHCFRRVGKGMVVTPGSLLSMILLDDSSGGMTWSQIQEKVFNIIKYCKNFDIPLWYSFEKYSEEEAFINDTLRKTLTLFIRNKKVLCIDNHYLNENYYAVYPEARIELLYLKNTILHHFFVPALISITWIQYTSGHIKTVKGLTKFLLTRRKELKYEFYLPSVKELLQEALQVLSQSLGREVKSLKECFDFTPLELQLVLDKIKGFASTFHHLYEGYYMGTLTLLHLKRDDFSRTKYTEVAKELFQMEISHSRVIRYPESFSLPLMNNVLDYFEDRGVVVRDQNVYFIPDKEVIGLMMEQFVKILVDQIYVDLKPKKIMRD
ncbi:MAG: 1-acyl-sn-glycerol-3-phosphate acyltransferase [Bacteriovoracaceae bacterium]|nr:1-acyl-sn-glycerol-3-phosphate acyltransferase [Bacteriovoracaceae bacterium]